MNFTPSFFLLLSLTISRSLLVAIFLTSSLPKLRHPRAFTTAVQAYHLLPQPWIRPFAIILPWLELALGLMLLLGWGTRIAALAGSGLLLVFLTAMGINLARGRKDLDCGCSGKKHSQKIGWKTIARNIVLVLFSIPVAVWGGGFLALDNQSPAIQTFVLETLLLHRLLPLVLSITGLWLLSRLLRQTVRLVMLTPAENQTSEVTENFRSLKPQVEVRR